MAAKTGTEVTAAQGVLSSGYERKLFTTTVSAGGDTVDLSAYFENIYYVRAWDVSDGIDAEAFVTGGAYGNGVTITQNFGAIYIEVVGTPIKSSGGSS